MRGGGGPGTLSAGGRRVTTEAQDLIARLVDHTGGLVAWPYAETWVIDVTVGSARLEERLWAKYGAYPLDYKALE